MKRSAAVAFLLGLVALLGSIGDVLSWLYFHLGCGLSEERTDAHAQRCASDLINLALLGVPLAALGFGASFATRRIWPMAAGALAAVTCAVIGFGLGGAG